jgi:DNA-binding NtrC family response regulator
MSTNHSYRVLVVDDDEDSRELMESALMMTGYATFAAPHAEAAIERLAIEVPDAIITDLTLPQMSGEDLAAYVRGRPELATILLVATSGRDVSPSTRALFDIVRPKPIDFDALIASLSTAFKSRVSQSPAFSAVK